MLIIYTKFHYKNAYNYRTPLKRKAATFTSTSYYLVNSFYILKKGVNNKSYP